MDYRDERDALRGRVDNLEQQLGEAKRELDAQHGDDRQARIARIEQQMGQAQRLLDGLGTELAALQGKRPQRSPVLTIAVAVAMVTLGAGVAGFLMVRRAAEPPIAVRAVPPPPLELVEPAAKTPPSPPTRAPQPASRRAHAAWSGKVTRSTGSAPPPGTACTVEATLGAAKEGVDAAELTVTCGGKVLYRSADPLEGMSMNGSQGMERAGAEAGSLVYTLAYDDKGPRSGARNEVSLDTAAGVGAVWRTSVPAFHVDFSVVQQSAPVKGEALVR